jgi:hypothetical protein
MILLLGNTESAFSEEIKLALGFIDADFPFKKMKADIRTVCSGLQLFLGADTYDYITDIYIAENAPEGDDADLLELAQYAVATAAYRMYAPANDLQHGKNGRKMLTDENSKTPFEHMLVSDNDELERRSFRAMDDFVSLLDRVSDVWKDSSNYIASHRLVVRTVQEFSMYHVISSRYLLLKMQPDLEYIEKREIRPRLGLALYDVIKNKLNGTNDEAFTDQESELIPLIREACVNGALSRSVIRLQGTLFPEGLLQQTRSDRSGIKARVVFTGNQIDQSSQFYDQTALRVYGDLESVLASYLVAVEDPLSEQDVPAENGANDKFFA